MGEVFAMTSDGTNDAPTIQEVSVGLGMGIKGQKLQRRVQCHDYGWQFRVSHKSKEIHPIDNGADGFIAIYRNSYNYD